MRLAGVIEVATLYPSNYGFCERMGRAIGYHHFEEVNVLLHDRLIPPDDMVEHDSNWVISRDQPMKLEVPPS